MPSVPGHDIGVKPRTAAWDAAAAIVADAGTLCDVTEDDQGRLHVTLAPGARPDWPLMERVGDELVETLTAAGYQRVDVEFVGSPFAVL